VKFVDINVVYTDDVVVHLADDVYFVQDGPHKLLTNSLYLLKHLCSFVNFLGNLSGTPV
jgi:hypothetical protein